MDSSTVRSAFYSAEEYNISGAEPLGKASPAPDQRPCIEGAMAPTIISSSRAAVSVTSQQKGEH